MQRLLPQQAEKLQPHHDNPRKNTELYKYSKWGTKKKLERVINELGLKIVSWGEAKYTDIPDSILDVDTSW